MNTNMLLNFKKKKMVLIIWGRCFKIDCYKSEDRELDAVQQAFSLHLLKPCSFPGSLL